MKLKEVPDIDFDFFELSVYDLNRLLEHKKDIERVDKAIDVIGDLLFQVQEEQIKNKEDTNERSSV